MQEAAAVSILGSPLAGRSRLDGVGCDELEEKTYVAVCSRNPVDDARNARIKGMAGGQPHGRTIRQADGRIREALAVWLDCEPDELRVRDEFPANVQQLIDAT